MGVESNKAPEVVEENHKCIQCLETPVAGPEELCESCENDLAWESTH